MNSIETTIIDIITAKLESGIVETLVAEQLEIGIKKALSDTFGSWGDGTKTIKSKIESVMIPFLEGYDYSEYILKLDTVLCDILKNCSSENKSMLENFKALMTVDERKEIKASELFEIWSKYVSEKVEISGLEVEFHDSPSYQCVEVTGEFTEGEKPHWSSFINGRLVFECEHDKDMNFELSLHRWENSSKYGWDILDKSVKDISSLRHLNDMEILIMKLSQNSVKVIIDETFMDDSVQPEAEPEASFS